MSVRHEFSGRVALVIGGTSGIGLATARGFARSGAAVAVAARDPLAGERAEAALRHDASSPGALFVSCDVRDEATVERAVCSSDAGFVTGAPLYVDGGFLAA